MIHAARETVYSLLFTLLQAVVLPPELQFVTTGRRLLPWTDVPPPNQPAMYLKQGPQDFFQASPKHTAAQYAFGVPTQIWTATVWIYYRTDSSALQNELPVIPINQYMDAFEQLLMPQPGNPQTLASVNNNQPLVYNCWIDGTVSFDDGLLDSQAVLVIPISILVGV